MNFGDGVGASLVARAIEALEPCSPVQFYDDFFGTLFETSSQRPGSFSWFGGLPRSLPRGLLYG